jgi:hypothetical protein
MLGLHINFDVAGQLIEEVNLKTFRVIIYQFYLDSILKVNLNTLHDQNLDLIYELIMMLDMKLIAL